MQKWPREVWNLSEPSDICQIPAIFDREIDLRICVYNGFDGWTESNCITIDPIISPDNEDAFVDTPKEYKEITYDSIGTKNAVKKDSGALAILIITVFLIVLLMLILLLSLIRMLLLLKPGRISRRGQ